VLWREDGPQTGGCHLLKMAFLSAPVHNFRAWMVGKTSLLESACDVASNPFEKYRLMQVLERDNGLPRHRMFPRQDEHVPLLEQHPAVDTLRQLHGVTDESGIDLAIQQHRKEPGCIRFAQIDSNVWDDPGELQEQFRNERGGDRRHQPDLERGDCLLLIAARLKPYRLRGGKYFLQRGQNHLAQLGELGEVTFTVNQRATEFLLEFLHRLCQRRLRHIA